MKMVIEALHGLQASRNELARQRELLANLEHKPEDKDEAAAWETEAKALVEAEKAAEADVIAAIGVAEQAVKTVCNRPRTLSEEDLGVLVTAARAVPHTRRFVNFALRHASEERWVEWKAAKKSRRHRQRQNRKRTRLIAIARQCERKAHPNKHNRHPDEVQ
jgi:hypothetical protein